MIPCQPPSNRQFSSANRLPTACQRSADRLPTTFQLPSHTPPHTPPPVGRDRDGALRRPRPTDLKGGEMACRSHPPDQPLFLRPSQRALTPLATDTLSVDDCGQTPYSRLLFTAIAATVSAQCQQQRPETLPSEATTEHDGHAADRPRLPRRTRADRFDRRTAEFRRMRELAEMFTEALGGPAAISAMTALKIDTAAEMRTIAELARARHIAGEDVSLDDVVRCERQAERAERALGIEARQAKPSGPSLADYLEEKGKAA